MRFIAALVAWIIIGIIVYFVVAYTGAYGIGADVPDWGVTRKAIVFLREHTLERRAANIKPPALDDPAMVREGAQHYAKMCTGCHLDPTKSDSDLRDGLHPEPPNLTHFAPDPAEAFWVIKHGLKMTAMPAWGKTHDDQTIWALVAFLQKQPKMSASEFRALTESPAPAQGNGVQPPPVGMPAPASSTH